MASWYFLLFWGLRSFHTKICSASSLLTDWRNLKEIDKMFDSQRLCLKGFLFHFNTSMAQNLINSLLHSLTLTKQQHQQSAGVRKKHLKTLWTLHEDRVPIPIFDLYYKALPIKYPRDLWASFHSSCFTPKITCMPGPVDRKFRFRFQLFRFSFF